MDGILKIGDRDKGQDSNVADMQGLLWKTLENNPDLLSKLRQDMPDKARYLKDEKSFTDGKFGSLTSAVMVAVKKFANEKDHCTDEFPIWTKENHKTIEKLAYGNMLPEIEVVAMRPKPLKEMPSTEAVFGALIQKESGGEHTKANGSLKLSPKGAAGITQLMPATIEKPGFGITPPRNNSKQEFLRVGKEYLQAMQQKFPVAGVGNIELGLMSYNAGFRKIEKHIETVGMPKNSDDMKTFVDSFPFSETRKYVGSIMSKLGLDVGDSFPPAPPKPRNYVQTPEFQPDVGSRVTDLFASITKAIESPDESLASASELEKNVELSQLVMRNKPTSFTR